MSDRMRFVGPLERTIYLRTVPAFECIATTDLAALADLVQERSVREGTVLLRADERVNSFFILVEGSFSVRGALTAEPVTLGPPEMVGLLSFLAESDSGVHAVALENSLVLGIDGTTFVELLEENLEIAIAIMRWLARRTLQERREIPEGAYLAAPVPLEYDVSRELDLVERVHLLKRPSAPFARSDIDSLVALSRLTTQSRIPRGTLLWNAGDRSDETLILISGVVACTTAGTRTKFRCGPGYPLGNLERICQEPRWYSAIAETDVVAIRSGVDPFLDAFEEHPKMAIDLMSAMAGNLIRLLSDTSRNDRPRW